MKTPRWLFHKKVFLFLFFLCLFVSIPIVSTASQKETKNKKILVVNSYHPGYAWSDDIMLGIGDVFDSQKNIDLIIEYLDTKRHFTKSYFRQVEELFRHKYKSANIDLVITSDDNALDFILGIRKELFPGIPLVFCGIDHIKHERIASHEPIFGIEEADSTASTIDLILSIHPGIESLTFIADKTSTGKLMVNKTRRLEDTLKKNIHFNYLIGVSEEELLLALKNISINTAIFYLSFIRDKNGKVFSIEDSMKLIAENANAPVYCSWGFQPDTGVLGGNVLSGYKQGEIAADAAGKLLNSDSVKSVPAVQQAPLVHKFDYQAMKRFNINDSSLPQNSIIYNEPSSFYSDHIKLIWSTIFIILCLLLFNMILSLNIRRRKQAEAELQKTHDQLELKVEGRTKELQEELNERKRAEQALKNNQNFLNSVIDQSPFAIWISDEKGTIIRCNNALEKILNISADQLIDKYNVFEDEVAVEQGLIPKIRTVFEDRKTANFSVEWDANELGYKDAKKVHIEGTMFPIHNNKGNLTNVVNHWIDVTRRKQAEKAKTQLETQLQQAQKMESIGNLAGGIAHDFNNLLFPIIGMSEMLLEDLPKDSLEYENAEEIFHAGKRAGNLVQQILAFSRQSEHKMTPVRVQNVLKEVLKLSHSTIPSNIEIHENIQQDCGLIRADSTQVHQVAMNLITNAYHAIEEKNGTIDITLEEMTLQDNELPDTALLPGQYVRLAVSDNGIGMSQNTISKIFEPYFTTKKLGKGTGLGLAVVYGIVKEHGGDIKVYSEIEKGTTFNIYLPLMKKVSETAVVQQSSKAVTGTESILLVDDELSVAKLEGQMLSRLGYQVTVKTSSGDALDTFKSNPDSFDLVISDMTMPGMTGDQLSKHSYQYNRIFKLLSVQALVSELMKNNQKISG